LAGGGSADEEDRERGTVAWRVWRDYIQTLGLKRAALILSLYLVQTAVAYGLQWWITRWSSSSYGPDSGLYITVFSAMAAAGSLLVPARSSAMFLLSLRLVRTLHAAMLHGVMRAPVAFFDATPLGRILNRFSKDQQVIDAQLTSTFAAVAIFFFRTVFSLCLVVAGSSPYVLLGLAPVSVGYYHTAKYYRSSARELQRLDSTSKSPLYAAFSEALHGAPTLHAMGAAPRFETQQRARFDYNLQAAFAAQAAACWLAVRLEIFSNAIAGAGHNPAPPSSPTYTAHSLQHWF